ncbi:28S ribosomal protein S15, mitochondrial-like [Oppia nitens]|uniref:28S ribosomal protein S15, mitochondrial-like n=1 Tax=Oppia nitens TaxID=1686743 RepID=UPI0023D9B533|nr:28S ribosomal protein S15, mitochondrial-like [Oppia nitens]
MTLRSTLSAIHSLRHQLVIGGNNNNIIAAAAAAVVNNHRLPMMTNDNNNTGDCPFPLAISRRFSRRYYKFYSWPNDFLPFYWQRQKRLPGHIRSGDAVQDIGTWDKKALVLDAMYCKELENAPEPVRRQFTLEFARRKDIVEYQKYHIMKVMQRNPCDTISPEARITNYTVKIRNLLHHFYKVDWWAAHLKGHQNVMVQKRRRMLNELYYTDRERFEFVTKTLKIDYTPPPLGEIVVKPTRKSTLRRLTREYCERIKDDKLDAYHQKLIAEQKVYEQKKSEIDDWIKDQDKYLGVTVPQTQQQQQTVDTK